MSNNSPKLPVVHCATIRQVTIATVAFLFLASHGRAADFTHSFNLYGDWTEYLVSTTNTEVYTEYIAGQSTYWRSTPANAWGEVVYHFPLPFSLTQASLDTMIAAFTVDAFGSWADPGAEAYLDISPDGSNWTTVLQAYPGNGGHRFGPGNITPIVDGSTDVYVRSRLYSTKNWYADGAIFAQFVRTNPGTPNRAEFEFTASGEQGPPVIPEPSALLIWWLLAALGIGWGWRRRKD